jgi:hypothetical protein
VTEKELRDRAVLGAIHPGLFDDAVEDTGRPSFDGRIRGDAFEAPHEDPTLRRHLRPPIHRTPGGWHTVEIEDGADLFFGQLGR